VIITVLRRVTGRQMWPAERIRMAEIELGLVRAPGARVRTTYLLTA
jgi:hypothetical protein